MDWGSSLENYFESSHNFLYALQSRTPDEIYFKPGEASLFRRLVEHNVTTLRLLALLITIFMTFILLKRISSINSLKRGGISGSKSGNKTVQDLPGPKSSALWVIGNGHELLSSTGLMKAMKKWCDKYGSCFAYTLFGQDIVVLNSPATVQKLLSSGENGHLHKSPYFYDTFEPFWNDGIVISKAEKWRSRRKVMARAFTFKSLLSYMHVFNKEGKELVSQLSQMFTHEENVDGRNGKQINKLLWGCALRVVCETTLGLDVWEFQGGQELTELLHTCKKLCIMRLLKPWFRFDWIWHFHPKSKELNQAVRQLQELTKQIIEKNKIKATGKTRADIDSEDDTLAILAKKPFRSMVEEMMEAGIDDEVISEEVNTLIIAGYETTASTLHFCLFLLALYPEYQTKSREEIDKVFANVSLCPDGELSYDALASLKHLERCILETLRLHPIIFTIFRKLETPLLIDDDLELPVGTNVNVFVPGIHHNPEYYPDPLQFKPERFLAENSQGRSQYAFIPFSAGPRNCIGYKYGLMEIKVMLAWILRNFFVSTTDKMEDVKLVPDIVLTPERGFNFILTKRQS